MYNIVVSIGDETPRIVASTKRETTALRVLGRIHSDILAPACGMLAYLESNRLAALEAGKSVEEANEQYATKYEEARSGLGDNPKAKYKSEYDGEIVVRAIDLVPDGNFTMFISSLFKVYVAVDPE